tara:strand:- start:156315 stop:157073 length:759 start_codon:yes stop_codon:yes gene_type:complete
LKNTTSLNADIGELEGPSGRALDAAILRHVQGCNIACGGHAGDDESMFETLKLCWELMRNCGAHPSYPDREGFGRRAMDIPLADLKASLNQQVGRLSQIAEKVELTLGHVKPHGALYNTAAKDAGLAMLVAEVCAENDIPTLVGPPNTELQTAAKKLGLAYVREGFVDRAYMPDGSLMPRTMEGAVIEDNASKIRQALAMTHGSLPMPDGESLAIHFETLCVHGDTKGAEQTAELIKTALIENGFTMKWETF